MKKLEKFVIMNEVMEADSLESVFCAPVQIFLYRMHFSFLLRIGCPKR